MANQLTGKVEHIGATQAVALKSGSTFNRRELVLQAFTFDRDTGEVLSDDNHPMFEFSGRSCEKLDDLKVGDTVMVSFKLQGGWYERNGERKNYTRIIGYDVEKKERKEETKPTAADTINVTEPSTMYPPPPIPSNDGLPF